MGGAIKVTGGLGLIYMNGRYYDPTLNRFLSADSIVPNPQNPQSFNRYTYSLNNPINRVDPTGHCSFDAQGNIDRFDCSLDEFDTMPITERERWIRQFMLQVESADGWFNNILGIIEGFVEYGLAEPGSWLSVVDAGILQGIQDGYAQSKKIADYSRSHPGAQGNRIFAFQVSRLVGNSSADTCKGLLCWLIDHCFLSPCRGDGNAMVIAAPINSSTRVSLSQLNLSDRHNHPHCPDGGAVLIVEIAPAGMPLLTSITDPKLVDLFEAGAGGAPIPAVPQVGCVAPGILP